jgi:hypothetical protein
MTLYIGVDIHARQQTVSYLDTCDGTTGQVQLEHERDEVREFYRQFKGGSDSWNRGMLVHELV